ncbi:MAG: hypothetical protein V4513_01370 [Pseudomonadota bacterium]
MKWSPGGRSGAERARWLADVSEALEDAQQLLQRLGIGATDDPLAMELYLRIEGARFAIQALRLSRSSDWSEISAPKRSQKLPWRQRENEDR